MLGLRSIETVLVPFTVYVKIHDMFSNSSKLNAFYKIKYIKLLYRYMIGNMIRVQLTKLHVKK